MSDAPTSHFAPIFVVGCARSGTTMLAAILDRHSQIAVPPETQFFRHYLPDDWASRKLSHEALLRSVIEQHRLRDLALDFQSTLERFENYEATYPDLFRAIVEQFAADKGKPRCGEKSPIHLFSVPTILDWYADARVVCIVRDGRDVVRSIEKMGWTNPDRRLIGLRWRNAAKVTVQFQRKYPNRFLVTRYEDIVREPAKTVAEIDAFLGVEFEARQLDSSVESNVVPDWEKGWKEKANNPLDPKRAEAWRREISQEETCQLNSILAPYLEAFDYPDCDTAGWSLAKKAKYRLINGYYRLRHDYRVRRVLDRLGLAKETK